MGKEKLLHPLPARIFHWVNVTAIVLLTLSGFYIHDPDILKFMAPMDRARFVHFILMYVFICGTIFRAGYALIIGDWRELMFVPKDIKGFVPLAKYYLFFTDKLNVEGKYNPGQKMTYSMWPVLALVQIITGFILYLPGDLSYLAYLVGGELVIRMIHYGVTWLFVITVAMHVYLAACSGIAMLKSIITGYLPEDFH